MKYTLVAEVNPFINRLDDALTSAGFTEADSIRANLALVKLALNEGKEWREVLIDYLQQLFQKTPQVGHKVPRDLLWFAGSECLHFLEDNEIERFSQIDEVWQTTDLSWQEACDKTQTT